MMLSNSNTSAQDWKSKNSRVFIGNLNTNAAKRGDIQVIFQRYGKITGISIHKGYAFVQYDCPQSARGAVAGENGRMFKGQPLDMNICADVRKRSSPLPPPPSDPWDEFYSSSGSSGAPSNYYDDYYRRKPAPPMLPPPPPSRLLPPPPLFTHPPAKRPRRDSRTSSSSSSSSRTRVSSRRPDTVSDSGIQMVLTGVNLDDIAVDRSIPCTIKFKTQSEEELMYPPPPVWECVSCKERFDTAWLLMYHAKSDHDIIIFSEYSRSSKTEKSRDIDHDDCENEDDKPEEGELTQENELLDKLDDDEVLVKVEDDEVSDDPINSPLNGEEEKEEGEA